jgi:hypothetical protein
MQPGQTIDLGLTAFLPQGYDEATDVLKVFATQASTSFRWFELEALDQPPLVGRSTRSSLTDPLEQLVAAFNADQAPSAEEVQTRQVTLVSKPSRPKPWAALQVEINVK